MMILIEKNQEGMKLKIMYIGVWTGYGHEGQVTYTTETKETPEEAMYTKIKIGRQTVEPSYVQEIYVKDE